MNSREAFEKWANKEWDEFALLNHMAQAQKMGAAEGWNAALSAAKQGVEIDGEQWQLVPEKPTYKIRFAFANAMCGGWDFEERWKAALTAAKEQQT